MSKWGRRLRAAIGMGLLWGAAWFGVGLILLAIVGLDAADVPFPLFFGFLGFLAGAVFAGLLVVGEGRRRFEEMSLGRFAAWGALGGVALAGVVSVTAGAGEFLTPSIVLALAGGGSAAGSLLLARKGERKNAELAGETPRELKGRE